MNEEFRRNSIFSEKMLSFIFENTQTEKIYTHYTHSETIAQLIMEKGFKFTESFYKTTQNIQNELVVLNYKHNLYEHYGEYMIIIGIPDDLIDFVKKNINLTKLNLSVEDYISITKQNKDDSYILPAMFIKGYIKYKSGEIEKNPKFLFNYHLSEFVKHL